MRKSNKSNRLKMFLIGFLSVFMVAFFSTGSYSQTLTTDNSDYSPGSTVYLTGTGFGANETVTLQVTHNPTCCDDVSNPDHWAWDITADGSGNFDASWACNEDELGASLIATANGQTSGAYAQALFTDGDVFTIPTANISTCDDGSGNHINFAISGAGFTRTNGSTVTNCSVNLTYKVGVTTVTPGSYSFPVGVATTLSITAQTVTGCVVPPVSKTVTEIITVFALSSFDTTVVACGSFNWANGDHNTYTSSGTYSFNVTPSTANGCLTVKNLHLTINSIPSTPTIVVTDNCDGSSDLS